MIFFVVLEMFTLTFDQFNAFLLNKNIRGFFQQKKTVLWGFNPVIYSVLYAIYTDNDMNTPIIWWACFLNYDCFCWAWSQGCVTVLQS